MRIKKILTALFFVFAFLFVTQRQGSAQCSVCRASAESNEEHGSSVGRGLNSGILYLLSIPYVLGGIGFYVWYKNKKKKPVHPEVENVH